MRDLRLNWKKRDEELTAAAAFQDRRSYISLDGHMYLRGKDRSAQRKLLFKIRKGICANCGRYRDERLGDYDHIEDGRPALRCDCFNTLLADGTIHTNIQWMCTLDPKRGGNPKSCHARKHNREIKSAKIN